MINNVGDLIGALQHHNNTQLVKVNRLPITAVIASSSTGTVTIYTAAAPNPSPIAVIGSPAAPVTQQTPSRLWEED